MVYPALKAALAMEKDGVEVAVLNARFIKPIDEDKIMDLAKRRFMIITVEEGVKEGGFGSAVLELFERRNLKDRVTNVEFPIMKFFCYRCSSSQWRAIMEKSFKSTMQSPLMSPAMIVWQDGLSKYDLLACSVPP